MDDKTPENMDQALFALKHGKNVTDRMVPDLLTAIGNKLNGTSIKYNGRICELKILGDVSERNGEVSLLFDVLKPDKTFDHVEFKITKTGWGRSLATPSTKESE